MEMPLVLLLLIGSCISISDVNRHIIPNRFLFYLFITASLYFARHGVIAQHAMFAGKAFILLLVLNWLSASVIGMGDLKYLLAISFLVGNRIDFSRGAFYSIVCAFTWGLVVLVRTRTLDASIPLAPSITAGYLVAMAT